MATEKSGKGVLTESSLRFAPCVCIVEKMQSCLGFFPGEKSPWCSIEDMHGFLVDVGRKAIVNREPAFTLEELLWGLGSAKKAGLTLTKFDFIAVRFSAEWWHLDKKRVSLPWAEGMGRAEKRLRCSKQMLTAHPEPKPTSEEQAAIGSLRAQLDACRAGSSAEDLSPEMQAVALFSDWFIGERMRPNFKSAGDYFREAPSVYPWVQQ